MLLTAEGLHINFGNRQLLENVNFYLNEGDKTGIIGINGTGKSTFLKVLSGQLEPDRGRLIRNPNVQISYLPQNPAMVEAACARWPGQITVGIDAKNGIVATRGWVESAGMTATELALRMKEFGVRDIIYTDVSRDGMMQGPNVTATAALVQATGMDIIGSGGVSRLDDLTALRDAGCAGAILGKALYEGAFTLPEAIALMKEA